MAGVYSRTAQCGMKVMFAAMRILQEEGGSCRLSDLRSRLVECLDFSSWEKEVVNGSVRWHNFLSWFSSCYVAAGFIRKQRGTWYLTDEGAACLSSSESAAFDKANEAYKEGSGGSAPAPSGDVLPGSEASFTLGEMKERADEGLRAAIASRSPYEFQDMVAALLHAMGYFTPFVAPKGKDGGVDVLAFHDPLGATIPRVKVQVKHTPSSSVSVEVVRQSACLIVMVMLAWWLPLGCSPRRLIVPLVKVTAASVLSMVMNSSICGFAITRKCRKKTRSCFVSLLSISLMNK